MRRRRRIKYIGYIRMTVAALLLVLIILLFDSLRRHAAPKEGKSTLNVTMSSQTSDEVNDSGNVPADTESSEEEIPYEKKEIDSNDYRRVVKLKADLGLGDLIMVNRQNASRFPDISADLVPVSSGIGTDKAYKVSYNTIKLQKVAVENFSNMMSDFYSLFSDGDVTVVGGFVSYAEQNADYSPVAADTPFVSSENQLSPGYSEHHTGLALDLKLVSSSGSISAYDGTGNYKWINDNCYKYGFIVRYPFGKDEITGVAGYPAHLRYVGVPHSYIMHDNGFTMEEYMNEMKKYIFGYEHLYYSVYGYDYEIYFVPAESVAEETVVAVPKKEDYSVSGNNCDGFIVTVCRKADGETWQPTPSPAAAENNAVTEAADAVLQDGGAQIPSDPAAETVAQAVPAAE
ncbi:M15 family metallopeptidase [Ruminococcus sp. HUN007]|uniref:M15 family metallopeptidase n=1 Tax=Ruminococcus sp. HUN007 TaxID=1514668 RepID=UPI000ADBD293|nr:M15 family metallopeptidase [Ruminococcus sp. HUN007]